MDCALPYRFSPLPGVLPVVTLWPVLRGEVRIGGVAYKAYSCPSTGSAYAIIRSDFVCTQAGAISIAATIVRATDGQLMFRTPYALAAIKWEDKQRFQAQQVRLEAGRGGDNSMLDRSLCMLLAERGGSAAPFLPRILECWHDDSRIYSVLEYHPAELRAVIGAGTGRRLDESTARRYTAQILAALSVLHGAGWCHRDISPENVLVSADGSRAVLIDFGTALPMPQAAAAPTRVAETSPPPPPLMSRSASYEPPASTSMLDEAGVHDSAQLKRGREGHLATSQSSSPTTRPTPAATGHGRGGGNASAATTRPAAIVAPKSVSSPVLPYAPPAAPPLSRSQAGVGVGVRSAARAGGPGGKSEDSDDEDEEEGSSSEEDDDMQGAAAAPLQGIVGVLSGPPSRRITGPQRSLRPIARTPASAQSAYGPGRSASAATGGKDDAMVGGVTGGRREAAMPTDAQPPSESNARAVERLVERDIPAVLGGFSALPPPPADGLFCKPAYACPYYLWRRPYFGVAFDLWSVGATLFCMLEGVELYRTPIPGLDSGFSLLWDSEAAHAVREMSDEASEVTTGGVAEGGGGVSARRTEPPGPVGVAAGSSGPLFSVSAPYTTLAAAAWPSGRAGSSASMRSRLAQLPGAAATASAVSSSSMPAGRRPASLPATLSSPPSSRGPGGGGVTLPPPAPSRFESFLGQRSAARVAAGLPPLSPAVVDLLCRLFRVRPQFRPLNAHGALTHAWFSDGQTRARQ